MKTLFWDDGHSWDDPNVFFGDPGYVLEPGDPGYVPPAGTPPLSTQKPKKTKMAKSNYIKQNGDAFAAQLRQFKLAITPYATLLGLTPAQVAGQAADADYFTFLLACLLGMSNGAQQWTGWKDLVRGGGTAPASGAPVLPVFPTAVAAVALGIEVRFRALVQLIKKNANYNPTIGEALGIEGQEQTGPDLATVQADLKVEIIGTHVSIPWGWGGNGKYLDLLEIEVDRDGQGFKLLTYDTTPGYDDNAPFPATPTKWSYRAIYRVGDARLGVWSATVSVVVGG